jgi:hypothetical protein
LVVAAFVIGLWIVNLLLVPKTFPAVTDNGTTKPVAIEDPGVFGDMFGGLNALFAGLALGGVAIALISQAEQQRRQAADAAELEKRQRKSEEFQERMAELQTNQVEALSGLRSLLDVQNRREYLQYLVTANTEEIDRIRKSLTGYSRGTPEERANLEGKAKIAKLETEIGRAKTELEGLGKPPA